MPNGGSDNCGTCGFNLANEGVWGPPGCGGAEAFCAIRILPIPNPYWTYCANRASREREPDGPLFSQGLYEKGYTRVPWHGEAEPRICGASSCQVCGRDAERGLKLAEELTFCCNAHYMQWWGERHPGIRLKWTHDFQEP